MTTEPVLCVVDNDLSVRQALETLLRSAGFHVSLFASAQEFLSWSERCMADCLITDLHMPDMDGSELARSLGDRATAMILISGSMTGDVAVRARALGISHVLRKPFDSELMIRCVEDVISRRSSASN